MAVLVPVAEPRAEGASLIRTLIPDKTRVAAMLDTIDIRENTARDGYYLNIKVETLQDCEWPRRWIYGMVSLKQTARWRADEFLRATGASDADLAGELCFYDGSQEAPPEITSDVLVIDTCALLGDLVEVEVAVETYRDRNGIMQTVNKIGKFFATTDTVIAGRTLPDDMEIPF